MGSRDAEKELLVHDSSLLSPLYIRVLLSFSVKYNIVDFVD